MAKTARRQIENSVANAAQNSAKIIGDGANRELTIAIQKIARKDFDAMDHFLNEQAETSVAGFAFLADHNVQTYFGGVSRIAIIEDKSIRLFPRSKDLLRNFEHYTREVESAWDIMDVNFSHAPTSVREYFERLKACASVGDLKNAQMEAHENIFYASFDEYAEDKRDVQLDIIHRIQKIESLATENETETEENEMTMNQAELPESIKNLEQTYRGEAFDVIFTKHPNIKLTENELKREIDRIFPRTLALIDQACRDMRESLYYQDGDVYWKEAEYDDYDRCIEDGDYWTRIEREWIGEARPAYEVMMLFKDRWQWEIDNAFEAESEEYLTSKEKEPSESDNSDSSEDTSTDIMCNYYDELLGYPSKHEKNLKHVRYTWRACASEIRFERDEHRAREVMLATIAAAKISERAKNTIYNLITQIESLHDEWKKIFDETDGSFYATRHVDAELDAIQAKLNRYAYQIFK